MSFSLDLSKAIKRAKGKQEKVIKKVMLETFTRCIAKSPVDTGRFRANWIIGTGSVNRSTTDSQDKRNVGDRKGPTVDAMALAVNSMTLNGQTVFLTNSLPYAHVLEYGRANGKPGSLQAPNGMVRTTLTEITAKYGA